MYTYVDMHTEQRLEEEHMEVDHAWSSELLKLDYELLFQRDYSGLLDRLYCTHSVSRWFSEPD